MKTLQISVLAMAAALSGCVNMAPDHVRPEPASAPAFDASLRPDGSAIASQLSYRDWFADPRLKALIAAALQNNRDLVAATARIEQARAQVIDQRFAGEPGDDRREHVRRRRVVDEPRAGLVLDRLRQEGARPVVVLAVSAPDGTQRVLMMPGVHAEEMPDGH